MTARRRVLAALLALAVSSTASAATFTVSPGGSITAALSGASSGDSVLVEAGSYSENIALVNGVRLLGGYDSSFSESTRDRARNRTILHGGGAASTITSGPGISAATRVEGFVITAGGGDGGAGVRVIGGDPVFADNEISGNRGGVAGGVYVSGGSTATFLDNLVRANWSAGSGGGIRIEQSDVTLVGNDLRDNLAPHNGGGLYAFQSAVYCSSNAFKTCVSLEGGGGGVYLQQAPVDARFVDNFYFYCTAPTGGGLYAKDESLPTLERERFQDCHATTNGGGVAGTVYSELTLVDCVIDGCDANGSGGGIYLIDGDLRLLGADATTSSPSAQIRNCSAGDFGGGLYISLATGVVDQIRFSDCTAGQWGGGLYILHAATSVTQNVVEGSVAPEGGGVVFRSESASRHQVSNFLNNSVYGCSGTGPGGPAGGGLTLAAGGNDNVANCAGNLVAGTLLGAAVRCRRGGTPTGTGTPSINCSSFHADPSNPVTAADVVGGARCDAALSSDPTNREGVDPQFCSPSGSDYRLQSGSPAVGTNCAAGGGKSDRGAHPDGDHCPGTVVSVEATSWGQIKAKYR